MRLAVDQPRPHADGVRWFRALPQWAIRHPAKALVITALLTLAAAPGALRLELRTDGHALVPRSAPEVIYDQAIRDQFGIEDQIVVLIRSHHPDGIFNPGTMQLIRDLTAEFGRLPKIGPSQVMSLATEPGFRLRPTTYSIQRLLEPALTNKTELIQLREDLRRIELYDGTLVSTDGRSTAILIGVPSGCDRLGLNRTVSDIIAARQTMSDEIFLTGAPVAESLLGIHILEDLGVPRSWLGISTWSRGERSQWKWPPSFRDVRSHIAHRVGLIPIVVLVMMLVFFLSFRSVAAMLLPLPGVVATLLFVFGLMGWVGVPIYLTIAVMPILLTATGVTNDVYLFSRYLALLREKPGRGPIELVSKTFQNMACPVAITSLTTGIGFLSFAFSPLAPVRAFGIWTAIGSLFGLFCSLTLVPALLTLVPARRLLPPRQRERPALFPSLGSWFAALGLGVVRWRRWVVGLGLAVVAVTPLGLHRLVIQDSWIEGFERDSEFRRATLVVNEHFHGMHLLFVCFDAPQVAAGEVTASAVGSAGVNFPASLVEGLLLIEGSSITVAPPVKSLVPGGRPSPQGAVWQAQIQNAFQKGDRIYAAMGPNAAPKDFLEEVRKADRARFEVVIRSHLQPEIVRALADLGSFIRTRRECAVGGVLGPADYLLTTQLMLGAHDPRARRFPASAEEIKLLWHYYEGARGTHRLREVMDTNYWRSLTTVFLKDANFVDTARLMSEIRAYEHEHLAPKGIKLGFAGDVALSQSLIHGIVTTQLQSLFWSLAGIYLVTALLGGSWRWGVYCVLPSALAVLVKFAVMGCLGVPLGVATSMFAAMTLGIGVNCAIQLLEGFSQAQAGGASRLDALSRALVSTGPPALINTLAVSLGFAVLMLSQVPANSRLGLLMVLSLVECFVVSLLLLPVLLHGWPLKGTQKLRDPLAAARTISG